MLRVAKTAAKASRMSRSCSVPRYRRRGHTGPVVCRRGRFDAAANPEPRLGRGRRSTSRLASAALVPQEQGVSGGPKMTNDLTGSLLPGLA